MSADNPISPLDAHVDKPAAPESSSTLNGHLNQNGAVPANGATSLNGPDVRGDGHSDNENAVPHASDDPSVTPAQSETSEAVLTSESGFDGEPSLPVAPLDVQEGGTTPGSVAELHDPAAVDQAFIEEPFDITQEQPRSTLSEWTITILLLLFLTTTLVQAYVIPTGSMEDTLLIGDHLLVDKLAFAPPGPISKYVIPYTEVKRGDIIVFRYPVDITQTFVKRAIGIPGDRIRVVNKEIYLNGVRLNEPYTYHKTDYIDSYRDNFPGDPNTHIEEGAYDMLNNHVKNGEVIVPPHFYFAMGDNRDQSLDSRYWGFVPRENITGKPLIVYWSFDAPTDELNSSYISWRHIRDLVMNGFSKTRWKRTFMLIHGYPTGADQGAAAQPAHPEPPSDLVSPPDGKK